MNRTTAYALAIYESEPFDGTPISFGIVGVYRDEMEAEREMQRLEDERAARRLGGSVSYQVWEVPLYD